MKKRNRKPNKLSRIQRKLAKKNGNLSGVGSRASTDAKLTYATLLLNYAFEYGVDFQNRVITLTGEIVPGVWFDIVDAALTQMEATNKNQIKIRINSPGGDTYEAMAVVGRIQMSRCKVITEGFGHVMSAATLVLCCGDKRRMHKYCRFMWHEASYGLHEGTRHSEAKHTIKEIEREEKMWAEAMADMSEKDFEYWHKTGVQKDKYYSAEELFEVGAIDEIIE